MALKQAVHGGVLLRGLEFAFEPAGDGNLLRGTEIRDIVCLDKGRIGDVSLPSCLLEFLQKPDAF